MPNVGNSCKWLTLKLFETILGCTTAVRLPNSVSGKAFNERKIYWEAERTHTLAPGIQASRQEKINQPSHITLFVAGYASRTIVHIIIYDHGGASRGGGLVLLVLGAIFKYEWGELVFMGSWKEKDAEEGRLGVFFDEVFVNGLARLATSRTHPSQDDYASQYTLNVASRTVHDIFSQPSNPIGPVRWQHHKLPYVAFASSQQSNALHVQAKSSNSPLGKHQDGTETKALESRASINPRPQSQYRVQKVSLEPSGWWA
ncbi:hypothetical protein BD779DRAFT_1791867 [Infundibulicybe gibba]|nr:hypothetical protein BD779DRAFT_1791867 [Infundibulicybe gibba]